MEHPLPSVEAFLASSEKMTTRDVVDFTRAAECLGAHPFTHVATWSHDTIKDGELCQIHFANGSSITLREPRPLKRLAFRNNWPPPSGADRAFVKACSRRLHARMEATVRELRACYA